MAQFLIGALAMLALWAQDEPEKVKLEPLKTSITVTAKISTEVPGLISALDSKDIESRPGINVDDRLRDVPGFGLFRRNSSTAAHPTVQGISLRGIGSSGASRTLVLFDGLPANDPFGGWVYWSRFNPDALDRVEVTRSASASVFGDRAMGGVVSLFTPPARARRFYGSAEGGNAGIADASAGYSDLFGQVGLSAFGRAFATNGYYIVPPAARGPVDRRAGADFVVGDMKVDHFGGQRRLSLKTNVLVERRDNGTPLQTNSSSLGTVGAHYGGEQFDFSGYHSRGEFHSSFSTVLAGRATERPEFRQQVPSEDWGAAALWRRSTAAWTLVAGADFHRPSGESRDTVFPTGLRVGGGHLWQHGLFGQTDFAAGRRVRVHAGLRHDFTGQGHTYLSPSGGFVITDGPRRWRGSAYRSFRAPTLNELFRIFRLGNTLTLANDALHPETLVGGEAGLDWQVQAAALRATLFWNAIDELIGNATVSVQQNVITQQRRNLGSATTRGVELELHKAFRRIRASASYMFVDARLATRLRIPQVGRHQGSAQLRYEWGKTLASAGIRSYSLQFEDDLNRRLLPGFATVQVVMQRRLARGFSAVAAAENLLNRTFLIGLTPTPAIGPPRLWRAGVRWESGQ